LHMATQGAVISITGNRDHNPLFSFFSCPSVAGRRDEGWKTSHLGS
jgi:hypothetical protein